MAEREFILGGQKSGKSRRAEQRAADWLAASPGRHAVLIATAMPHDDEMRERIARHRADRAQRVPGLVTVEEPVALAQAIDAHSAPETLVGVDCLTLWLTNLLMPLDAALSPAPPQIVTAQALLLKALADARGPIVLVGNEIGLGVIPLGREVRAFVDALGRLNQEVAAACDRVTLMAAGLPLALKEPR
ncbi:Adenosylcobinamide kinase [Variovorax sp. SRS16]|uniref:bifunctional adenosylcobinamide kinase/adenosylcobinamide-phosphate guanylyltransferase n=1 Tax=Variovorax sp. SRS16 TaxID=282217 RepID=UPI001318E5E7|nr:bifunctional adenosylcobinamide kinase/adenosylcobinamide-phosphate guanylyltransferase [Variovorax sp. SRS16]VTU19314.1 Adenosylcobinamide kinase [Variovorax sp. SRS16]